MNRVNTEGGLTFDNGLDTAPKLARQVAWTRQARAYRRLRDKIDVHYLRTPRYRDGAEVVLVIPHRLSGWRSSLSELLRAIYPELVDIVEQIERLHALRAAMRTDKTYVPPSTHRRGKPLPADPLEREAERTRRAVASMRRLREARRTETVNTDNLDLIGG
jgi:hypothetical protein